MEHGDVPQACPDCQSPVRPDGTEFCCTECGLVCARREIDRGPEWREFTDDSQRKRRTGPPLSRSRHDRGLSTTIGYDSGGRVTGRKRRQFARMRREHKRANLSKKTDQNQFYGYVEIRRIQGQLSLPLHFRDQACVLFRSAQAENLLQGRSIEGFAAACLYAVCRTSSLPRTIDEIVSIARADRAELLAAYRALNRELGLETGPIDPRSYLPRFASTLDLETAVEQVAQEAAGRLLEERLIGGRNPAGVAAGCLYYAARESPGPSVTQAAVAELADVAATTVSSTVSLLEELE